MLRRTGSAAPEREKAAPYTVNLLAARSRAIKPLVNNPRINRKYTKSKAEIKVNLEYKNGGMRHAPISVLPINRLR